MKRYSNYVIGMFIASLFFLGLSIEAGLENMPSGCAVLIIISFCLWYVGVMAPDHEKYKES